MKIFYLPLEPYKARYTIQLSRPKTGWFERRMLDYGADYVRVEGNKLLSDAQIKQGVVLDACGRSHWSLTQMANMVRLINIGAVKDGDAIYMGDFWTPGFEALPYVRHITGIDFSIWAFCYAQSVDVYDFTYPMRSWIRHFEVGQASELDGIFVTSTQLKELLQVAGCEPRQGIFVSGLPYASDEVLETAEPLRKDPKEKFVMYCSRWDYEKHPEFFLRVMKYVVDTLGRDDIKFVVTTSHPELKSNVPDLIDLANHVLKTYPKNFFLRTNLSKWEYYQWLQRSKVQFNCAHQDWTSWTLLEATTFGCLPCYPNFRSFPEVFGSNTEFLYQKGNALDAAAKVVDLIDSSDDIDVSWIYRPFDRAAYRILDTMSGHQFAEPLYADWGEHE